MPSACKNLEVHDAEKWHSGKRGNASNEVTVTEALIDTKSAEMKANSQGPNSTDWL